MTSRRVAAVAAALVVIVVVIVLVALPALVMPRAMDPAAVDPPGPDAVPHIAPAAGDRHGTGAAAAQPVRVRAKVPKANAPDASDRKVRVSGTVVHGDDDAPVEGARVRSFQRNIELLRLDADADAAPRPPDAECVTGPDGRFALEVPEAGGWRVCADEPQRGEAWADGSGERADLLLELRTDRGGVLRIVDKETAAPIAGACVFVGTDGLQGGPFRIATSAADGRVRISCADGDELLVVAEGHRVESRVWDRAELDGADVALEPCDWLRGHVVRGDGTSVPGALVYVGDELGGVTLLVGTGPEGRFTIPPRAAAWRLNVEAEGLARKWFFVDARETEVTLVLDLPAFVEGQVVDEAGAPVARAIVSIELGEDLATDVAGRFRASPVTPGVRAIEAESGEMRCETYVALRPGERRSVRLVLRKLLRSHVVVRAELAPEYELGALAAQFGVADGGVVGGCNLTRDGPVLCELPCPVGMRLVARVSFANAALPLVGAADAPFVTGTAEEPAEVLLRIVPGRPVRLAVADETGTHPATGDPPGHGVLAGGARATSTGLLVADGATFRLRVTVPGWLLYEADRSASEVVDGVLLVKMQRGACVHGVLVTAEDEEDPPRHVHVKVRRTAGVTPESGESIAASNGEFAVTGMPRGEATLDVLDNGEPVLRRTFRVAEDDVDLGEIRVPRLVVLRGRVVDERGRGVAEASAKIRIDGGVVRSVETEADGAFEFRLPEGTAVDVSAEWDDRVARWTTAHVGPRAAPLTLRVERRCEVLVHAPCRDAGSVGVRARSLDGAADFFPDWGFCGAGLLRVQLPAGRHELQVSYDGCEGRATVDLKPGDVAEVEVRP